MFKKKLFSNNSLRPFKLSRTKIDLFIECRRCFFLDQKFGIKRPHGTPLVLSNRIVDDFKKELNICRVKKNIHSKVKELNKNLIPMSHNKLEEWKSSFKGVSFLDDSTNLLIFGIIDDIWRDRSTNKNHSVIIKSNSKKNQMSYENIWPGYWRQLSLYSFLLSKNLLPMSSTGILVFINTPTSVDQMENKKNFNLNIFEKILDFDWIEPTIKEISKTLNKDTSPESSKKCKYCNYYYNVKKLTNE
jgi:CRISPR/Cas system-associated exonuclease Cas4 (RecB family)